MTKKIFLIVIGIVMISCSTAFSQNFRFGLVAGFDMANWNITNIPEGHIDNLLYEPIITYNLNGYIGYKKSELWGLSIEPGFMQKGSRRKNYDKFIRYNLNYLQLPVLLDYYIFDRFYISIGPEFSYLLNAKIKSNDYINDVTTLFNRRFELSGLFGLNYMIGNKLEFGIRYNHGLSYISKIIWSNDFGVIDGESKDYNQYFQVVLKFKI